jgi:MFS family permease
MATHSYRETLKQRGLQPFLWTQFLGAFNDNLFKIVVSMLAVQVVSADRAGRELSIVSAVFILPFLLFSGYAGQLADVYSKRTVLVVSCGLSVSWLSASPASERLRAFASRTSRRRLRASGSIAIPGARSGPDCALFVETASSG